MDALRGYPEWPEWPEWREWRAWPWQADHSSLRCPSHQCYSRLDGVAYHLRCDLDHYGGEGIIQLSRELADPTDCWRPVYTVRVTTENPMALDASVEANAKVADIKARLPAYLVEAVL